MSSDNPTKRGHLFIMTDARENTWERRWFVLRRSLILFFFFLRYVDVEFEGLICTCMPIPMRLMNLPLLISMG